MSIFDTILLVGGLSVGIFGLAFQAAWAMTSVDDRKNQADGSEGAVGGWDDGGCDGGE